MDEYIKTGKEIANQFDKDVRYIAKNRISLEERANKKWVSLDWLKEQLVVLDINLSSASYRAIALSVDGKKEMHRGFLTYNEVDDMIRELKTLLEG